MPKSKTVLLFDIDDVLFNTAHFLETDLTDFTLYEDVLTVLDEVGEIAEIGILSQGELELQTKKLIETGIHDRFVKEHIHIVAKKDESLKNILIDYLKTESIIFVDDRLIGLYHAKKALPQIKTIWFKRGRYEEGQEPIDDFTPDFVIEKLSDVTRILKQE